MGKKKKKKKQKSRRLRKTSGVKSCERFLEGSVLGGQFAGLKGSVLGG